MSLFKFGSGGTSSATPSTGNAFPNAAENPMKDIEVPSCPDDTISSMEFSPPSIPTTFLISGSWDNKLRCWEVQQTGQVIPKAEQAHQAPIMDVAWCDDGTKVFSASVDKTVKVWDLNSNQMIQVAQHDAPVKTVHWIKAPNYQCIMTGSWDRTLRFWDGKQPTPIMNITLPERCYCAGVIFPMAVVSTANRGIILYNLNPQPAEERKVESPLKYQHRCVAVFKDKTSQQPNGFALGSIEGRVAIQYPANAKDNFTFKCHRSNGTGAGGTQDIYPVNGVAFHPQHGTLVTYGADGKWNFWDKDARTKLKSSEQLNNQVTSACFNASGHIFAYATGYDWSKGHEFYNPNIKSKILLRNCYEEMKPGAKKS